jgi:CRISPR/Cas system-associated endoribonuclease Cas2
MKWLFLVHQILTPNSKERVKVWRAIKKTGAVLYRNSVYILPFSKERLEDFQWVCQQINDSRGEASIFVSSPENNKEDALMRAAFRKVRDEEYASLFKSTEQFRNRIQAKDRKALTSNVRKKYEKEAKQLRESFNEIRSLDFFPDSNPKKLQQLLSEIAKWLAADTDSLKLSPIQIRSKKDYQKKIWTTREGIHIDRLCSAWLIRRFIDRSAKFIFAPEKKLPANAIPFDVFGAEFSHHGDDCTFETLLKAFRIQDRALQEIAEIIHDIDLKDHKFGRVEANGLDLVIRSLGDSIHDDHQFLELGSSILDGLYEFFHHGTTEVRSYK